VVVVTSVAFPCRTAVVPPVAGYVVGQLYVPKAGFVQVLQVV
jgi:hypothetical protein